MSNPELPIKFTDAAASKVLALITEEENSELKLRVYVTGGGCSGFQYKMELTEEKEKQDQLFGDVVLSDDISLSFLDGATVSFEEGLIGSEFKIDNPNAVAGCGCAENISSQFPMTT